MSVAGIDVTEFSGPKRGRHQHSFWRVAILAALKLKSIPPEGPLFPTSYGSIRMISKKYIDKQTILSYAVFVYTGKDPRHLAATSPFSTFAFPCTVFNYLFSFDILAHSFALTKTSTPLFLSVSALFAKNHPGWGEGASLQSFNFRSLLPFPFLSSSYALPPHRTLLNSFGIKWFRTPYIATWLYPPAKTKARWQGELAATWEEGRKVD